MKRTLLCVDCPRRGTLLIAVLACLTLCAMLLTYWLRLIALERRQVRSYHAAMQTELLVDAALARSKLKAGADPQYSGETWQPAADILAAPSAKISVVPAGEDESRRQLEVSAEIRVGPKLFTRRTRTLSISDAAPPDAASTLPAEEPAP